MWFRSVVVITLASHARGPGFDPQRNQLRCFLSDFLLLKLLLFADKFAGISSNLSRDVFSLGKSKVPH